MHVMFQFAIQDYMNRPYIYIHYIFLLFSNILFIISIYSIITFILDVSFLYINLFLNLINYIFLFVTQIEFVRDWSSYDFYFSVYIYFHFFGRLEKCVVIENIYEY